MDPTAPPVPSLSLEEPQAGTELALQHPSAAAAANVTAAAVMAEAGSSLQGVEAEVVLLPLRLAIESRQSRMMETALDCLHVRGGREGDHWGGIGGERLGSVWGRGQGLLLPGWADSKVHVLFEAQRVRASVCVPLLRDAGRWGCLHLPCMRSGVFTRHAKGRL